MTRPDILCRFYEVLAVQVMFWGFESSLTVVRIGLRLVSVWQDCQLRSGRFKIEKNWRVDIQEVAAKIFSCPTPTSQKTFFLIKKKTILYRVGYPYPQGVWYSTMIGILTYVIHIVYRIHNPNCANNTGTNTKSPAKPHDITRWIDLSQPLSTIILDKQSS